MLALDDFDRQADELDTAATELRAIARSGKPPAERDILRMLTRAAAHEQWVRMYIDAMTSRLLEPADDDPPPSGTGAPGSGSRMVPRYV